MEISLDPATWFASFSASIAVVAWVVYKVRSYIWKTLKGFPVIIFSAALGVALGALGQVLGYLQFGWPLSLGYGLAVGLGASFGHDVIKPIWTFILSLKTGQAGQVGSSVAQPAGTTRDDSERARIAF